MEKKKIKKSNKFKFVLKTSERIHSLLLIILLYIYSYNTIPYYTKLYCSITDYIILYQTIAYETIPRYIMYKVPYQAISI